MRNQRLAAHVAAMQFRGKFYLLAAIACKEAADADFSSLLADVSGEFCLFPISWPSCFSWLQLQCDQENAHNGPLTNAVKLSRTIERFGFYHQVIVTILATGVLALRIQCD